MNAAREGTGLGGSLTRREWMGSAWGASAGMARRGAGRPPNVLLILTDDQGYGDLACHGNPYLRTPHLDRLAKESTEFTRFYVSPVCAPTRSSLLTGRYNLRCGVYGVTRGFETMWADETTLAEALAGAGYRTALYGKWHLGEHYPYLPHAQGFEEFIGFRTGHWPDYFDTTLERNGKPYPTEGFISDVFTNLGLRFLEQNRRQPFFLYMAYNAPHSPYQAPEESVARFRGRDLPPETAVVYGMVENLDASIGRLLARLEELGLAGNTIVIFLTDNGPNGRRFNCGLRAAKGSVYDGGIRAPFFLRWPGRLAGGRRVDTLAAHIDVYPTVLELCGVKPPEGKPLDGVSLRPLLEGGAAGWSDRMFFTHRGQGRDNAAQPYPGAVRTQRFHLINGRELYDITQDPGEQHNLAARHPEMVSKLDQAYQRWYEQAARECGFTRKPIPVGYREENPVRLPASQSYFGGKIRYHGGSGFAHDWLTGWTRTEDSVHWELDVTQAGSYEIALEYACPLADVGSQVEVRVGTAALVARILRGTSMTPVPNRNLAPGGHYIDLAWQALPMGRAALPKGRTRLTVKALRKAGAAVMDLKGALLRLV